MAVVPAMTTMTMTTMMTTMTKRATLTNIVTILSDAVPHVAVVHNRELTGPHKQIDSVSDTAQCQLPDFRR